MITIIDRRTGRQYDLKVAEGTIKAADLRQIKVDDTDFGLMSFDPGLTNTASCHSSITFIDGDKGILRYRGYPIEQLAEKSSYIEVIWLLLHGELPTAPQLQEVRAALAANSKTPAEVLQMIAALPASMYPMAALISATAALGAVYPDARAFSTPEQKTAHIYRIIAQMPALAAAIYRRTKGLNFVEPDPSLSFAGNFLRMMFKTDNETYTPNATLEKALDVLFMLHEDHEQNCSTSAVRNVASSGADLYSSMAGGVAALLGPLHGGANEAVLRMLHQIGTVENIPAFVEKVKSGEGRLMGFGHRVYKTFDPRAKIIKELAYQVFAVTGTNPYLDIAIKLEQIALADEYFIKRKLYPNVDFYSGLIYEAMGIPVEMFPLLFAIGRTPGWTSQWLEFENDPENKIVRPLQIYTGYDQRDVPAK